MDCFCKRTEPAPFKGQSRLGGECESSFSCERAGDYILQVQYIYLIFIEEKLLILVYYIYRELSKKK